MADSESDAALVARAKAGDKQAFNVLVLKYQHKLIKLISRYVHDQSEAMDVAQEAFIKAYRALPRFRGDSSFYTWLYRIAINTAKNHLVSMGRRPPDSDVDAQDAERYDVDSPLKDHESPEALARRDEVQQAVLDAIEELPEDLRTAVTLREFEGMTYEEIAQAMDCPIGTVRSRIFRAREAIDRRLRPLLSEATGDGNE
ncbi:RNA polymerase sigma factor RpoE [Arhodomonas sp. SL1]|uniref:RNA polymerase sigma factor RpoE n=1 Tax=Arhodomonas sp. SL1 TaxID=3425691 RepID=UPI003F880C27